MYIHVVLTPVLNPHINFHKLMGILRAHTGAIGCIGLSGKAWERGKALLAFDCCTQEGYVSLVEIRPALVDLLPHKPTVGVSLRIEISCGSAIADFYLSLWPAQVPVYLVACVSWFGWGLPTGRCL